MGDGITYPTRTVDLDSDHLLGERQRWMEEGEANGTAGIANVHFIKAFLPII